jgi:thiosulfate/3-mercaptopyruvate sulfurtransferase
MFPSAFVLALLLVAAQAPRSEMLVSTQELAQRLSDAGVVVLHVADREASFTSGHIPGARFIRYGDIAVEGPSRLGSELPSPQRLKEVFEAAGVSDNSHVIVYGASTVVAARAFFTLDVAGHPRVALLDGGLAAWKAENRQLETGPSRLSGRGTFNPKMNPARVTDAVSIQRQMGERAIALLDIRPDPEYLGTDGGMGGMHTPGHIAGAEQLPWNTLVGQDGKFLPREQLEAKLAAAGAVRGKPVVTYCMVGMRASVAYFVARDLGYDARLYDGSIVDWSQRKLPTKTGR